MNRYLFALGGLLVVPAFAAAGAPVAIDFQECSKSERTVIYGPMGSTTYQIMGKSGAQCLLNWGSEVENPKWDGKLQNHCSIPASLGKVLFPRSGMAGLDFSFVAKFCRQ